MEIKIGNFEISKEETKKYEKIIKKKIVIVEQNLIDESENFIQFDLLIYVFKVKNPTNFRNM